MPPPKVAKMLARIAGCLLILMGLIAFVPNSLIGAAGLFRTDMYLNAILIVLGLMLLAFTTKGEATAATGLYFTGMAAFAVAMVGYVYLSDYPSGGVVKLFNTISCKTNAGSGR